MIKRLKGRYQAGEKNSFYGKKHTEKTRHILSLVDRSGNKNSMYGNHHNINTKEKMSIKKIGIYDGINNPRARNLYQYSKENVLIKKWDFAKECADFYKISRGNISTCAKFNTNKDNSDNIKFKVLKGFIFKYI